jgi:hypothetical protein
MPTAAILFDSDDTSTLQAVFDRKWESAVTYTVLIAPDREVLYQRQSTIDILELRRTILARYWAVQ